MAFTYDTEPTTTYTTESTPSEIIWDDTFATWDSPLFQWGGFYNYDLGVEPSTSFTNDTKP